LLFLSLLGYSSFLLLLGYSSFLLFFSVGFSSFFSPCFAYLEDFSFFEAALDDLAAGFCSVVVSAAFTYVPLTLQLSNSLDKLTFN